MAWGRVYFQLIFIYRWTTPLRRLWTASLRHHTHGPLDKRLMHMAHLSGNTSGVSKSSSDWFDYTRFPGDVCVAFFNITPGNKDAVSSNPLTKEKRHPVYNCDAERLSGSTKRWVSEVCGKCKVHWIESLKYIRELYTPVCYCGDISVPRNELWLVVWHVSQTGSWVGLGQ